MHAKLIATFSQDVHTVDLNNLFMIMSIGRKSEQTTYIRLGFNAQFITIEILYIHVSIANIQTCAVAPGY